MSVDYSDKLELIKYYLAIKVYSSAVSNIYKIRNHILMREAKNCDLDLSVEWFQLSFRGQY